MGCPPEGTRPKPGVNRFGRSLNSDFPISHPSVSSAHCEMVAADGAWLVKDLGSTNGTLLDGKPVRESPWQRGQTLRLGEVEIAFAPEDAAPPPEPPAEAILRMAPVNVPLPPRVPGVPALTTSPRIPVAAKPAVRRPQGFFAALPGAFAFPFRRNGLILLASGAVFFVILNFASRFVGIVGVVIGVFCSGYLFTFLKCIITTTALGDDEMPDWPEFEGIMVSGVWPFLEMLAVFLVCLAPVCLYILLAPVRTIWLIWTLWAAGMLYLPMALLALAIYDTLLALNPMLILPSILRVPLEYAAACLVLGLLALGSIAAEHWLRDNAYVPVLAPIVAEFLLLYTLTVVMRVAGLLYYAKKDSLSWKLTGK